MSDISVSMTLQEDVSAKLKKITSSARSASRQLSSVGKAIDGAFRSNSAAAFASKIDSAFDSAESDAESLGHAIDSVADSFESFSASDTRGIGSAFTDAADKADSLSESISKASESAEGLSGSTDGIGAGSDGIDSLAGKVDGAGESMDDAASKAINFSGALKTLFAVVSAAAIMGQVKDFASNSVDLGKNYTAVMSEVAAISGASQGNLAIMEAAAREYGATTVFSASEAAEALKYMSLAGWDAQQSTSALGGVLNLAAASGMGLGEASDMVTDYLSAFGMEANQSTYFADMLAYAQSNSNTTATQLGEAYKNAAANMHAAGQDVETTTSLLEAMANQGRKGSEAGTSLAAVMRDVTAKMDDGSIKIGDTSIAVQDASGNFRDMTDILTEVGEATDGMGSAQRAAALSAVFTDDSIKAVNMVLAEGMDKVAGYEEALRSAGGASEEMAAIMNDNLSGDMANMNSAYEEMQLQVFEAMEDPLREGAQWITEDIIPTLTEWVPDAFGSLAGGISEVGRALSPMIKSVLQNPKAIGNAFLSIGAGFAAMKTVNTGMRIADTVNKAGGLTSALGKIGKSLFGSPWAAGAAAAVGAITAVGFAIKKYNDIQVADSLDAHFGDIELDDSQIEAFASRIIDADWLVNINTSLGHFENSEELAQEAESALATNDALEWKARVGIELTQDEQSYYMQNIEAFKSNIENALTEKTLAAKMVVETFDITMADGSSLGETIGKWAEQDLGQMEYLSSGLTNLVQNALQDGILDVDEQAAIDQLQQKISNIMSGWQEAEAQAELDMLTQKYGRLSGADLEAGGFTSLVTELGEQRETAANALYESEKQVYATLNALNQTNEEGIQRISDTDLAFYKEQVSQAARNAEVAMLMNSVQFEKNTMEDTYGNLLTTNYANVQAGAQQSVDQLSDLYTQYQNGTATMETLFSHMENSVLRSSAGDGRGLFGFVTDADQSAIHGLYEVMKPDMQELQGVISEYQEVGQAVPQQIMDQFNDAMLIGAAAGDMDAAWYTYARSMVENGDKEMIDAIQSGELAAPQEFKDALELAMTKTTDEPITLDGLQAELNDIEVNEGHVNELLAQAFEGLEATGQTTTINGVAVVEYEVTAGQTMSEIASECGIALDELIAANPQIENPNVINVGQKINIPASACTVDASGVGEATNEAVDSQTGQMIEKEQPAKITITDAGTDASSAVSTSQDSVNSAFSSPLPANGSVDVTLEKGNDNVSAVYSSVGDIVKNAWSNPYSASGSVNVVLTANYSLANPSATISFGGGGSGSATVTASLHAAGGIFDEPHLGVVAEAGPEAIIPLDGSGNAFELWQEAGKRLGALDEGHLQMAPTISPSPYRENRDGGQGDRASRRSIDININGSGSISAGKGVSKEDIVQVLMEKVRDVFVNIVTEEALVGGDAAYEF